MAGTGQPFEEIFFTARDGLKLHARAYPAQSASAVRRRAAVCLPGLTRNGRDFHDLALALSSHPSEARDVFTFDYRGRGLSEHDKDWRNYAVPIEMLDVVDFMTMKGLSDSAIIGTSRGGLIAMVMASVQPSTTGVVVLNDIGPVIEAKGLARIAAYVGRVPLPGTWAEAAKLTRDLNARAFPAVTEDMWEDIARQLFNEVKGRPAQSYDQALMKCLSVLDGPVPVLWPQFESLKRVPLMVVRGEKSDILSAETVEEMRRRHPSFTSLEVKGQGHAPLLKDRLSIEAIGRFLAASDAGQSAQQRAVA